MEGLTAITVVTSDKNQCLAEEDIDERNNASNLGKPAAWTIY